ncbi:MAG: hypothetical protein K2G77_06625, partial [Muribaculaceae bacterium]|nr:hypothetical protein [Muribaculaceae bacterium]
MVSATHPPHHKRFPLICGAKLIRKFESAKFFAIFFENDIPFACPAFQWDDLDGDPESFFAKND